MFNSVRSNLNAIKLERERYNRDTTVVYKCYPSEKRLQILTTNLVDISNSLVIANKEITDSEREIRNKEIKITSNKGSIESLTRQIDGIDALRSSFDTKLNDTESSISLYNTKIENYKKQIENISELRSSFDTELYQKESRHSEVPKVLEDINKQIKNIDTLKSSFDNKLKETENKIEQNRISIKTYEQKCEELSKQEIEIIETNVCYVCKQPLKNNSAGDIVKARMNERAEYMIKINTLDAEIINLQDQTKILREKIILERNTKLEEYKKEIDNLRNEDIEICSRIPVLKNAIIKEREEKRKEFLSAIKNYENIIIKSKEEIEGLKQAIITEKEQMIEKCKNDRENLITDNAYLSEDMTNADEILIQDKEARDKLTPKKERIQACKMKLEARLKQKEYIYTERDVIVVKKAIEELDKLSSVYLVETVRSLEPIINSVLEKIGFEVTFDVDIKGKFNILLGKGNIQYKYKDLSCGQKLILQIALKIALLLQQSKTGLMISDEGLSALENDNLEDIINLFKDLQFQLVFVLHRASLEDPEINIIKIGV
jgi:chromosome segregation ATPase